MSATQFWLIRHGETQWNADRRLQGWRDVALNATGIEQARCVAAYLGSSSFTPKIDVVLSSDLGRALNTARIGAAHLQQTIETDALLRERNYGIYEGQDWAELKVDPGRTQGVDFDDPGQAVENGESLRAFNDRIVAAFEALAQRHASRNVLVFTHGGVVDIVWRRASQLSLQAPRPEPILNGSINHLSIDHENRWSLVDWGITQHLESVVLSDSP